MIRKRFEVKGVKIISGRFIRNLWAFIIFKLKTRKSIPVLVYQMGKVGSKSVHAALLKQYYGFVGHAPQPFKES